MNAIFRCPILNPEPYEMIKWIARTERTAFVVRKEIEEKVPASQAFG
jgi:hypothetical protein